MFLRSLLQIVIPTEGFSPSGGIGGSGQQTASLKPFERQCRGGSVALQLLEDELGSAIKELQKTESTLGYVNPVCSHHAQ
jgi:hypothetical protein